MDKKGFTLSELLVSMAVFAILSSISIPFFSSWLPNYRLKSSVRDIYNDMSTGKLRAIKERSVAVILFSIPNDTYTYF